MKKKIKDLTLKEARKICLTVDNCEKCPLNYGYAKWCHLAKLEIEENKNLDLEKEVEVNEKME